MLGERIRQLRTDGKYTMEEFAELIGVSRQTLSKWEFNETTPDLEKCIVIANTFGMTIDEFIYGNGVNSDDDSGKYMFGVVEIDKDNRIAIPQEAQDAFGLSSGDKLLMLGDSARGIALVKIKSF